MYRQGLGDCFLLTLNREDQEDFNILIDCGLFQGTKNAKMIMQNVAQNISETTNKRLNVVVLTHDHYDHTSGFLHAREIFDEVIFDEVWVGWTENENHPKYKAVRERYKDILKGIRAALNIGLLQDEKLKYLRQTALSLVNEFFGVGLAETETEVDSLLLNEDGLIGATGSSKAWDYVLKEKSARKKYCSPGSVIELKDFGVRIYVLGPPEDYEIFAEEEPKGKAKKEESYRHSLSLGVAESFLAAATDKNELFRSDLYLPFDTSFRVELENAKKAECYDNFFTKHYGFSEGANDWRRIDKDWLAMLGELALWMDDYTNNTCLALAIELIESGKVLLFPGDAQYGNWISWQNLQWKIIDQNATRRIVSAEDLLAQTVFYKVGHHGSHNATLRKHGLEMMNNPELVAVVPTNREFAASKTSEKNPQGWQMPDKKLFDQLQEKAHGRVIMADEADTTELIKRCKNYNLSTQEMTDFLKRVNFADDESSPIGPLFVEYVVGGN
jgi:hypothetical protein